VLYLAGVNEHAALRIVGNKRWRVSHLLWTIQFFSTMEFTSFLSNLKLRSRSLGAMMDLMRNRANFALTDFVYKSRSIAQGQDSERKSSNFRLATIRNLWRGGRPGPEKGSFGSRSCSALRAGSPVNACWRSVRAIQLQR